MRYESLRFCGAMMFGLVMAIPGLGQSERVVSPQVNADRTVTFRFRAPGAKEVLLALEGAQDVPMAKGVDEIWSLTTSPLEPDYYGYNFVADGVPLMDPNNWMVKPNYIWHSNMVHVPGPTPAIWDETDVPHGIVHQHTYKSGVVGDIRDFYVYTPPGYDAKGKTRYPVLYLLHGYSDDASAWTAVGRANFILDNLLAQGKMKPMVVVMPLGYGAPEILDQSGNGIDNEELRLKNYDKFRQTLLTEVIPQVEKAYRISDKREEQAITGLSMGGTESLYTALNNLDRFAWIGAFSSGGLGGNFETYFTGMKTKDRPQLLWVACGKEDHLIDHNRTLVAWLKSQNMPVTAIETPGAHTWMVWRRNLAEFLPLIFRKP